MFPLISYVTGPGRGWTPPHIFHQMIYNIYSICLCIKHSDPFAGGGDIGSDRYLPLANSVWTAFSLKETSMFPLISYATTPGRRWTPPVIFHQMIYNIYSIFLFNHRPDPFSHGGDIGSDRYLPFPNSVWTAFWLYGNAVATLHIICSWSRTLLEGMCVHSSNEILFI
jgi:hypothetical protein